MAYHFSANQVYLLKRIKKKKRNNTAKNPVYYTFLLHMQGAFVYTDTNNLLKMHISKYVNKYLVNICIHIVFGVYLLNKLINSLIFD